VDRRERIEVAPRWDPRIVSAARALCDERMSVAEIWRRVGGVAAELGVPRPSYSHVRRLVLVERDYRAETRELAGEAIGDFFGHRTVDVARLATDARDARLRRARASAD